MCDAHSLLDCTLTILSLQSIMANRFCGLCRTWEKRHWLLRKRQRLRDRERVGSRQRSLSSTLVYFSTWETSASREIYNWHWECNSLYKGWVTEFKGNRKKALCKCCDRMDFLNFVIKSWKSPWIKVLLTCMNHVPMSLLTNPVWIPFSHISHALTPIIPQGKSSCMTCYIVHYTMNISFSHPAFS